MTGPAGSCPGPCPGSCPGPCHCGAVRPILPAVPDAVTRCNCTLCTKLGTRWAYFSPGSVAIEGGPVEGHRNLFDPGLVDALPVKTCDGRSWPVDEP